MRDVYIFDLDGTLALIDHRRHFIARDRTSGKKPDWDAFHAACVDDLPNPSVITMFKMIKDSGAKILIFSGRSAEVREETEAWLDDHGILYDELVMRNIGDNTADEVLKRHWYGEHIDQSKERVVAVFDDRDKVVKAWRDMGLTCFQVAPGDF